jgi:hypothetical protein
LAVSPGAIRQRNIGHPSWKRGSQIVTSCRGRDFIQRKSQRPPSPHTHRHTHIHTHKHTYSVRPSK